MRLIATLALALAFATSAFAEKRIPIGSVPLKDGSVVIVQEYLSKARLPEKVMITSPYEEVYAFKGGTVTKVLEIDDRYSVFVKNGDHYYVYNNLYAVAVDNGDRLDRGDILGSLNYDKRFGEYQMEMQIWQDNGRKTCRLVNDHVVCILSGKTYTPKPEPRPARHKAKHGRKGKGSKYAKSSRNKNSRKYASKAKSSKSKSSKSKAVKGKVKSKSKAKKPVARKKKKR